MERVIPITPKIRIVLWALLRKCRMSSREISDWTLVLSSEGFCIDLFGGRWRNLNPELVR